MRVTPVVSLEAEANILPLVFRREQLMMNYFCNVLRLRKHPVTLFFNDFVDFDIYSMRPYHRPVIGRARMLMEEAQLHTGRLERVNVKDLYLIGKPEVRYNLLHKKSMYIDMHRQHFLQLRNDVYNGYIECYTDGSKMNGNTGYAFIINDHLGSNRLLSICSVFTAELYAIYKAVEYIESTNWEKIVICSDSLSSLQAIDFNKLKCHYMIKLQKLLALSNKEIVLKWLPVHVGIPGNT